METVAILPYFKTPINRYRKLYREFKVNETLFHNKGINLTVKSYALYIRLLQTLKAVGVHRPAYGIAVDIWNMILYSR